MSESLELFWLRLKKLAYAASRSGCWRALRYGVAPSIEHVPVLRSLTPDLLLDVGANRGQFTLMAKMLFPLVPVHAYEPLRSESEVFRRVHGARSGVSLHPFALGDAAGTAPIHISHSADSSSLLPIGDKQLAFFPRTAEVGSEVVNVAVLDELRDHWQGAKNALLKIDVQGFELKVLLGAKSALKHCRYVYAECSSVPLYTGQPMFSEVSGFLHEHGFSLKGKFNEWVVDGTLVQADYLFERRS